MADIMANLKTFQPEYGAGINEPLLHLRCRVKGLTATACAHILFFCKVLQATRPKKGKCEEPSASPQALNGSQTLKIGIIGGGHIGKQLARVLLQLTDISGKNIQISTRQPEKLSEFQMLGVNCFYNNRQLADWADVIFLCCLPSHLPNICSEVQDALKRCSIIYSLVTAIPLPRLRQLLSCNSIIRPQYTFRESAPFHMWTASRTLVEALRDPAVIQATCPCNPTGEIVVNTNWLAAVFYAALNSYTWQGLRYARALALLNQVCFPDDNAVTSGDDKSPPLLECENFINQAFASTLLPDDCLPWFDLTTVQLKDSPLSQLLTTDVFFRDNIASFYCNMLTGLPVNNEESVTASSTRANLSAVLLNPIKTCTLDGTSKAEEPSSADRF
nr:NADP-dependent oxidoreductase domain-containing protein 1 isoform X1 [Pogona vitticeps]XP_020650020.1 NADP-dependent oxidoreductase domain-containing protein 1 isoform X1 [Pogona vitticeps]